MATEKTMQPDPKSTSSSSMGALEIPKPKGTGPSAEVGVSYALPFVSGFENAWEVMRTDDITVAKLVAMRLTDGQAQALYRLVTLPIRAALKGATFIPEKGQDGGEEEAQFVENMFTLPPAAGGMSVPLSRFISQMLLAVFDGFSAFEMVYHCPKSGPLKGKWALKKIARRPPESLTFLVNDNGEYAGLRQRISYQGTYKDIRIPAENSFYFAVNEEENPFYGRSFFNAAFHHWDRKVKLYFIVHLAAQRSAIGTRVGTAPDGATEEELAEFYKALQGMTLAQFIMLKQGFTVSALSEAGNFDFLGLINHHNSQMSKSILASFFDKDQGAGTSDGSLVDFGKQSDALFLLMLQTIMDDVAAVINNQIIPRFIDWNFGSGKYPEFRWGELTPDQLVSIRQTFEKLAAGTVTPEFMFAMEKKIADQYGLDIDYDAVQERIDQDREMQEQQMNMQMGLNADGSPMAEPDPMAGTDEQGNPIDPAAPAPGDAGPESAAEDSTETPGMEETENGEPGDVTLTSVPLDILPPGFQLTEGGINGDSSANS